MRIATGAVRPRNDITFARGTVWNRRADRGVRPYGWGIDGAVCGGTHGSRPTLHYFVGQGPCALPGVRGKNPPVTASPCQPPLGKGAEGTGVRIATGAVRPRNDIAFARGTVWNRRADRGVRPYGSVSCGAQGSLFCIEKTTVRGRSFFIEDFTQPWEPRARQPERPRRQPWQQRPSSRRQPSARP